MRQVLFLSIAMLVLCAPVLAECPAAEKRALEEWDRAWGETTRKGDRAALQQIYAEDYLSLNPASNVTRSQAIDNAVRGAEAARRNPNPPPPTTFDYYNITCTPNTAVITHRNTARRTVDGKEEVNYSRSVHVLEKRGGRWQVISDANHPLNDNGILAYLEREWGDAMLRKDTAWFERNLANEFTSVDPMSGSLMNKTQTIDDLKNMSFDSLSYSDLNTRIEGNTAVVTGIGYGSGRLSNGEKFEGRVRFTDVFVKRDGRWQALSSQATMINDTASSPGSH